MVRILILGDQSGGVFEQIPIYLLIVWIICEGLTWLFQPSCHGEFPCRIVDKFGKCSSFYTCDEILKN